MLEDLHSDRLVLGKNQYREAYELGVANLLKSLASFGSAGEFDEGIGYAMFTVTSLLIQLGQWHWVGIAEPWITPSCRTFRPGWFTTSSRADGLSIVLILQPSRAPRGSHLCRGGTFSQIGGMPFRPLLSLIIVTTGRVSTELA